MTNSSISVRPVSQDDFEQWSELYRGYADFYQVEMNDTILANLWDWLVDSNHEVNGFLAVNTGGHACGFAHVRRMPSPLRGTYIGFLDDLFVSPDARGQNVGKVLFNALEEHARREGWPKIRWITADDNYRARALYDQLSVKTKWNTYEMDIE
ncbi:MAG: GNAT family N-acetyltransferase [Pseudomonadota bacterium]